MRAISPRALILGLLLSCGTTAGLTQSAAVDSTQTNAPPTAAPKPRVAPSDESQVVDALTTMYAAASTDDVSLFNSVVSPSFYAFDNGKRYDGDALMKLAKGLHASGKVYVWTVTEPEVHIAGKYAWITYTNRGSVRDASGTKQLTWLESAFLEKDAGLWRIHFFESTRAQ
jgi:Domain of unknown function (DUF4440)